MISKRFGEYSQDSNDLSVSIGSSNPIAPLPAALSYREVVNRTGMSWSNMLKATSKAEFRQLSSPSHRRNFQETTPGLPQMPARRLPYQWTRTEQLEKKISAADRPYRSTYGDGSCSPSKLYLSTEFPNLQPEPPTQGESDESGSGPPLERNNWVSNRHIAKIYKLLHSGDTGELSKLHVYLHQRTKDKNLPTVLPQFQLQLSKSIRQVLREEEISPEIVFKKRPMTSEKITYRPINEHDTNPELIISKTGKVDFRKTKKARQTKHIDGIKNVVVIPKPSQHEPRGAICTPGTNSSRSTLEHSLTLKQLSKTMEQESPARTSSRGKLMNNKPSPNTRNPGNKPAVGVASLESAEGFQFSVKITPRLHPANDLNNAE